LQGIIFAEQTSLTPLSPAGPVPENKTCPTKN